MSLVADAAWVLAAAVAAVGAYSLLSVAVILVVPLPEEEPLATAVDALAFALVLPFALAVVVLPTVGPLRRVRRD